MAEAAPAEERKSLTRQASSAMMSLVPKPQRRNSKQRRFSVNKVANMQGLEALQAAEVSTAVDSASAIKAMEKQGVAYVEDKEPAISCCGLFRAKPRVADPPPAVVASPVTSSQGLAVPSISHDASADVDEVPKAAVARKTGARQSHSEGGGTMGAPPSMTPLALGTTSEGAGSPASAGFLDEVISISRRIMGSLSNRQDTTAQLRGNAARKVTTELKSPHAESHQARQHL